MRSFAHWNPRYIVDRIAWGVHQRLHPDWPWIVPAATELLAGLLQPESDLGVEWGSGRSTAWFAARLRHLTSVENDPQWHQIVTRKLADLKVANVTYRFAEFDDSKQGESPYVRIVDEFEDGTLNFALVDGAGREHCALAVLPKLAPGAILAIDNINWYLDHPSRSPASRVGLGPASDHWRRFELAVKGWRSIWVSQGVTDTALWFKA